MIRGVYLFIFFAVFFCALAGADVYRWEDNRGYIYYSDKVPPDHARYRREQLNKQGRTVRLLERAITEEELEQERALRKLRAEEKRLLAEQRAHDRALLHTFRSEEEIKTAFQRKLNTMNGLIKVTEAVIGRLKTRMNEQQKRAAALDRNGKTIPKRLVESIHATQRQIADNREKIDNQNQEQKRLRNMFAQDIARFRNLTGEGNADNTAGQQRRSTAPVNDNAKQGIIGLITCADAARCDDAWELARKYVEKNASTKLQINTDHILVSADPRGEKDISLTVSKIPGRPAGAQLFLSVRCKQSSIGQELCAGSKVRHILSGFRPFIEAGLESSP